MAGQEKATRVSLQKIHYAVLQNPAIPQYGEVRSLIMPISLNLAPNVSSAELSAGDRVVDQATQLDTISITGEVADFPQDVLLAWFGHTLSTDGGVITSNADEAPFLALGIQTQNKMIWLYKVKLQLGEDANATKQKGEIAYKTSSFTGEAIPLDSGLLKYSLDRRLPNVTLTPETFFSKVRIPTPASDTEELEG